MKLLIVLTLAAVSSLSGSSITRPAEPPGEAGQTFVLQDYLWVPVTVHRTPTAINCSFEVVNGAPSVHAELISESEFMLFVRHREYESLALTSTGSSGAFQHMIETPGRYRILIRNDRGAPPAAVTLVVHTEVDPQTTISTGISVQRKLVVILASLTMFFGTAVWSGRKLLRAYRNR